MALINIYWVYTFLTLGVIILIANAYALKHLWGTAFKGFLIRITVANLILNFGIIIHTYMFIGGDALTEDLKVYGFVGSHVLIMIGVLLLAFSGMNKVAKEVGFA
ncbi:hypothetical protein HY492_01690 [Candidatus Woesearchaeota archaeon]|nr:hypothetical protein [Candidatus Woesearchaeota archaeon]